MSKFTPKNNYDNLVEILRKDLNNPDVNQQIAIKIIDDWKVMMAQLGYDKFQINGYPTCYLLENRRITNPEAKKALESTILFL
jgi:hypothetical protein